MWVGINYPWCDYGWDFGVPPTSWGPRARWRSVLASHLAELRRVGVRVVRWFIVADGLGYGVGADAPRENSSGHWTFSPPRVAQEVLDDFSALLDTFHETGHMLMPVLLDFHFAKDAVSRGAGGRVSGGRASVFSEPSARRALLRNLLEPLLEVSQRHPTAIYAWDLFNEPEGCTDTGASDRGEFPNVQLGDMIAFLREGTQCIRDHGFAATVGYRRPATSLRWSALAAQRRRATTMRGLPTSLSGSVRPFGESFWQFHYYTNGLAPGFPPRTTILGQRTPVILGEFATEVGREVWPDLRDQTIAGRLAFAQDRGIQLAMPWSFRAGTRALGVWSGPQAEAAAASSGDDRAAAEWQPLADQLLQFTGGPW
jgi:hypothetical protein